MKTLHSMSRWTAGFKIGTQLLVAFTLLIVLTAALGGYAILQMSKVKSASDALSSHWMPGIGHTTTIRASLIDLRELQVKHVNAADAGYMEEYEEKMKALTVLVEKRLVDYQTLISDAQDRTEFNNVTKSWKEFLDVNQKVISLSRAEKRDDAKDIGDGAAKSVLDDSLLAVDKLTQHNFAGGERDDAIAGKVYKNSIFGTLILLGLATGMGAFLALIITSGLLRQLGGEPAYATSITRRIAAGDLAVEVNLKSQDDSSLLFEIKSMRENFAEIVSQVRLGSEGVATASAEIAQGHHDLSARTEQQASALEETAASMEELGSTVKQNSDSAGDANRLAMKASTIAVKGGAVVAEVVNTMKDINTASRKISDIISVIDGIAFQTNILALNAAVEAARAGEQGRGFAVVASEVRSLASRSAEAAKEIKTLIGASVERVEMGTALVDKAGATMAEVVDAIRRVTEIMGTISTASIEQSLSVTQVVEAVGQMDQTTQQNAALVEQMAAAASSLQSQADELVGVVAVFRLGDTSSDGRMLSIR